jgi:hypothetical protein
MWQWLSDTFFRGLRQPRGLMSQVLNDKPKRLYNSLGSRFCRWFFSLGLMLLRLRLRLAPKPRVRRSLWAGTPILNMAINARAERLLGVQAESLVWETYFITNDFTYDLSRWRSCGPWWFQRWFPWFVLLWACFRYDRFHFYCDRTLTQFREVSEEELKLLRSLGKEIYFYAYGADIRTRNITHALGEPNFCTECPQPGFSCVCSEQMHENNYQVLTRYATAIFSTGDTIHYTPGSRKDLFYLPVDLEAENGLRYHPQYPDVSSKAPIRVVHAPNHRGFKGTRYIIAAVERLRAEGLPLELILVEGVPNRQAIDIYRTADIIFDQCMAGGHGYFALEAMAIGKPVMVFIRDPDRYLLDPKECPLINSPPDQVEAVLRDLVRYRQRLFELGKQGRQYIEKHFSMMAFAMRLKKTYRELGATRRRPEQPPRAGLEAPPQGQELSRTAA